MGMRGFVLLFFLQKRNEFIIYSFFFCFYFFLKGLLPQNIETLDVSTLTPLTPEVVSRQATINIGTAFFY